MFRNYDKNSIDSFIDWWVDVFFFYLNLVNYSYSVQSKDLGGRLYFYQLSLLGRKANWDPWKHFGI